MNCTFGLFFPSTFVIAAVNVVLPWSTCPIVPMFTCGLLLSNFSFDMSSSLLSYALDLCDYFFRNALRRLLISLKVHSRSGATLSGGSQVSRITKHLSKRHERDRKSTSRNPSHA